MKKRVSVLLTAFIIVLSFCACGNNDSGNIGKDGTLTDDVKGIIDDGDLDMNDNTKTDNDNGSKNNSATDNNTNGTANDTTGAMTDDATK